MRPVIVVAAASAILTLGCSASTPPGGLDPRLRVHQPEEVDRAPELVACGDWIDHGESRLAYAVVQFVVTATGEVRDPRVIQTPPRMPDLGVEALRVARTCRFRPALLNGEPVAVRWAKRFDFPERQASRW